MRLHGRFAWRTSARLIGWLPAAGSAVGIALLLALDATVWRGPDAPLLPAARVVETIVPLAVGLHAAFLLSPEDEQPLELLLTCPRSLSRVLAERLLVMAALQGGVALTGSLAGLAMGVDESILLAVARWLAPAIFIGGAALFTTQLTRKGVLSALVSVLLWGGMLLGGDALPAQTFFLRPVHVYLQPESVSLADYARNRISLALAGGVLAGLAFYLTYGEERLLGVQRPRKPDRRAYLWLALGSTLLFLSTGRWAIPLAAWLAPIFVIHFLRRQTLESPGTYLNHLALVAVVYTTSQDAGPGAFGLGLYALALFYGLYLFLPYLADRLVAPRLRGFVSTLAFPLAWVTLEYAHALLSPMNTPAVAYTQYGNLPLLQIASITGMYGVTFLVTWLGSVVNWAWEQRFAWPKIRGGVCVYAGVLALVLLLGGARLALLPPTSNTVRVAAFVETDPEAYLEQSEREAQAGAQIVVWPEGGVLVPEEYETALVARGREIARREGIYLAMALGSIPPGFPDQPMENKAVLIDPAGEVAWEYLKSMPVPGLEPSLPGDGRLPVLDTPHGRVSAAICHDMDFPHLIRQAGAAGVDLLLAPSNDVDEEAGPLHAREATLRAIENGFSLVRPNGAGLSLAMDYQGRVLATMDTRSAEDRGMIAHVPLKGTPTVYGQVGDAFAWLCVVGFVALVGLAIVKRYRS